MSTGNRARRRILFSIAPATGHLNPVVPLAHALQRRGNEVKIATSAELAPSVRRAGLEPVITCPDLGTEARTRAIPDFDRRSGPDQARWAIGYLAKPMAEAIVQLAKQWRPDLIVRDGLGVAAWAVGEELGIPTALFAISGIMPMAAVKTLLGESLAELRADRGLPPDCDLSGFYGSLVIDTTPPSLQQPGAGAIPQRILMRPSQWTDGVDGEPPPWLAELGRRPLVYITLGTVLNQRPDLFRKLVHAVAPLEVDAVLTVGTDGDPAALGELPANVRVAPYIPQERIFKLATAVVCHGGRGTTYGALDARLPVCMIPLGTDQPSIAAAVERAGAGVVCSTTSITIGAGSLPLALPDDLTVTALNNAIVRTLTDATLRQQAGVIAAEIRAMPAPDKVAARLESLTAG